MSGYSDRFQMNGEEETWCKFRQINGNWHILLTQNPDPQSLEQGSSAEHIHYWQDNNNWYVQTKVNGSHTIGRDYFTEQINNYTHDLNTSQVRDLADLNADRTYGDAGYDSSQNIHGVQVISDYHEILNEYIKQYQSSVNSVSEQQLNSINPHLNEVSVATLPVQEINNNQINWIDDASNVAASPAQETNNNQINWIDDASNVAASPVQETNNNQINWIDDANNFNREILSNLDLDNIGWIDNNQSINSLEDINSNEYIIEISTENSISGEDSTASTSVESSSNEGSSTASASAESSSSGGGFAAGA
jgi:hypothetical protein